MYFILRQAKQLLIIAIKHDLIFQLLAVLLGYFFFLFIHSHLFYHINLLFYFVILSYLFGYYTIIFATIKYYIMHSWAIAFMKYKFIHINFFMSLGDMKS